MWFIQCEVCARTVFRPEDVQLYVLRSGNKPDRIDLGGRDPYSGVRAVCNRCVDLLAEWKNYDEWIKEEFDHQDAEEQAELEKPRPRKEYLCLVAGVSCAK